MGTVYRVSCITICMFGGWYAAWVHFQLRLFFSGGRFRCLEYAAWSTDSCWDQGICRLVLLHQFADVYAVFSLAPLTHYADLAPRSRT